MAARGLLTAFLTVGVVVVSLVLAGIGATASPEEVPFSGLWIGALCALGVVLAAIGHREASSGPLAVILSWLSLGPLILLGAGWAVGEPLVRSGWVCGTGEIGFYLLFPFVAVGLPAFVATVLGALLHRRRARPTVMALAAGVCLLGSLVAGSALFDDDGVEPDAWLTSLPVVARAPAGALGDTIGPIDVTYVDEGSSRYVTFAPAGAPEEEHPERFVVADGQDVVLRRDERAGIWIVEIDDWTRRALHDGDTRFNDVSVHDVSDQLVAPSGWTWTAALGSLLALGFLWVAVVAGRRPKWLARARAAVVGDDSRSLVFLDGAMPSRGVTADLLPPGPALALPQLSLPTYRTEGSGPFDAYSGTRGDHERAADLRAATWAALALVTATLSLCPLLAALRVLG